ncbi:MAG TPA: hypothetical protein VKP12_04140, partial [Kiloniellaceae bacterium]|nr:hypothetical protein [Kiloniellaceae bacterium]
VGPGGRILPHDAPATLWASAVREYWNDPDAYRRASEAAEAHAARPEIDPARQIETLAAILAESAAPTAPLDRCAPRRPERQGGERLTA